MKFVVHRVDGSKRADYVRSRHQLEPAWADEAVNDPAAYWIDPDPASASGRSVRVIGYSGAADAVLTVIVLHADADPAEPPDGDWWGANAWRANNRDQRIYRERQS